METRKRKIVQIAEYVSSDSQSRKVIALCDDGTLWLFKEQEWIKFPEIPQQDFSDKEIELDNIEAEIKKYMAIERTEGLTTEGRSTLAELIQHKINLLNSLRII
ncbi:hypothetical protein BKG91_03860 [Rodentibacter caecimuris]|uniref:Uncharacterized protein n=1 Tax=Rodentibacter caecimuris TaxID=1796644 RepID=A0AAJ3K459_9PAST|nr:hypothetical protein [Rodentibacter heylii]OOF70568.1 hypothetical protein BKG90_09770 [Rodentibacter heylii]OOF75261.1 hypothetical protein BKG91_03860 [Rodentibacter heylii]OOF77183.1 hypothetical protein BKG99_03950 [Rodentibacter heylii]